MIYTVTKYIHKKEWKDKYMKMMMVKRFVGHSKVNLGAFSDVIVNVNTFNNMQYYVIF